MIIAALIALGLIVFFLTLTVMELNDRTRFIEEEHGRQLLRLMQRIAQLELLYRLYGNDGFHQELTLTKEMPVYEYATPERVMEVINKDLAYRAARREEDKKDLATWYVKYKQTTETKDQP